MMRRETVEQDLVVMREAGDRAADPLEDVDRRAETDDADLREPNRGRDDSVFGGLPLVGERAAGKYPSPGQGLRGPAYGTAQADRPPCWPRQGGDADRQAADTRRVAGNGAGS